jgi:hypothetical protein
MPRKAAWKSEEQEYEEWLGRLDVPVEKTADIETFQEYLREELGITGDAQIDALWSAVATTDVLAEHGIRGVTVRYPWGTERRYGVQGMPGLWSWESVMRIRSEEGW